MKQYKLEIILTEGSDEFWDALSDKTGCDEVLECIREELMDWDADIQLVEFKRIG